MPKRTQLLFYVLAAVLLAATFSDPVMTLERNTFRYVFVFDITQSMNVADVPGQPALSRMAFAKQAASEALRALPCGTEVGLALFSGHRAFLLTTPIETCRNYRELTAMIDNVDWRMTWELRSEVAKGLIKSMELMTLLPTTTRLAFFTDGHEAPPINPDLVPRFSGDPEAVAGLVVGVGGDDPVPIPKFDAEGNPNGYWRVDEVAHVDDFTASQQAREGVAAAITGTEHLSSLKADYLGDLAARTGLDYHRLSGGRQLARELKRDAFGIPATRTTDVRPAFAFAALLVLLATFARGRARR